MALFSLPVGISGVVAGMSAMAGGGVCASAVSVAAALVSAAALARSEPWASPVADAPALVVAAASGDEDSAIALDIAAALSDTDGSESLSDVTISGIPAGAVLSVGTVVNGSVTLTQAQLVNLTITPPDDSDADFTLSVSVTSTEGDGGDSAVTTVALPVSVALLPGDRFGLLFWIFLFLGVMAIWKHRINIQRLMNGTEHRAWSGQKTCN